jgi:hypothetical protein
MADPETFDGIFWLTLSGAIIGFLGLAIKQCFNSKCSRVRLCFGLISVERDVDAEDHIHTVDIEHGINNNQSQSSRNVATVQPLNINRNVSQ